MDPVLWKLSTHPLEKTSRWDVVFVGIFAHFKGRFFYTIQNFLWYQVIFVKLISFSGFCNGIFLWIKYIIAYIGYCQWTITWDEIDDAQIEYKKCITYLQIDVKHILWMRCNSVVCCKQRASFCTRKFVSFISSQVIGHWQSRSFRRYYFHLEAFLNCTIFLNSNFYPNKKYSFIVHRVVII